MKRFAPILAAVATTAVITLPAVAQNDKPNDDGASINACLRTQGANVPADLRGIDLKQWISSHMSDPGVQKAFETCSPPDVETKPAPEDLIACLRQHGLNPPTDIAALKQWSQQQSKETLKACDLMVGDDKTKPADCGGGPPKDAQAEAAKRRRAAAASRQ